MADISKYPLVTYQRNRGPGPSLRWHRTKQYPQRRNRRDWRKTKPRRCSQDAGIFCQIGVDLRTDVSIMYGQKPYADRAACRPLLTTRMTPNKAPKQMRFRMAMGRNIAQDSPERNQGLLPRQPYHHGERDNGERDECRFGRGATVTYPIVRTYPTTHSAIAITAIHTQRGVDPGAIGCLDTLRQPNRLRANRQL
jgi:hypothetical protein